MQIKASEIEMADQNDPYSARKGITFEQAEGVEPLPSQLKTKVLTPELRALLWEVIYRFLAASRYRHMDANDELTAPWDKIFYSLHIRRDHAMADEFENDFDALVQKAKKAISSGKYYEVFGWIQFVLRSRPPDTFARQIQVALERGRAAYRVVDTNTIAPFGSDAERDGIERAFADLAATEFHGARKHLREAAEKLTAGQSADSIRESIHAVESIVGVLEPKGDFAKALGRLEGKAKIHGALKAGFSSLYGFTSDEKGIRHPLLEKGDANVDESDALFMLGACAAFVSYLINKAKSADILSKA
jgi:hypothetical protein